MSEPQTLTPHQVKFQNRVIAWRCMLETFGGSWGKVAKHFKVKKAVLLRYILDDLEQVWGKKLDWKGIKWGGK